MEEWTQYKLIDVLDTLIDYRGKTPKKTTSGVPLITAKIIKNGRIETPTEFISYDDYSSWMVRGFPKVGDVVLTTEAPLGEVAQLDNENVALAQRVVTLRGKAGILDNTYLKYYLLSNVGQQRLKARETGTTVTGIKQSELREVLVDCPPYDYQQKIASILKSLDDKIECNRRINENLEQQAQALFKSWFVDFEPFKNQPFVESELGMIPQGWRVGTLGDICVTNKRTYKGDFVSEIEYLDTGCVTNNIIDTPQILNPAIDKIPSRARRAVTEGDIIYSSVRPNQRHYALLFNPSSNTVVSTGFVVITANWSGYRYYIYQYLIQDEIVNKLQAIAEQSVSTFPSLNASDLTNLKIVIPPNDVVGDFAALNCSFITQINKKQQESRRLAELRDTLLPRLMSGELKVNDLENNEI